MTDVPNCVGITKNSQVQPVMCSQESHKQSKEPTAKRAKMSVYGYKFSYSDLHDYLFKKQDDRTKNNVDLRICGFENTDSSSEISTNQKASNITKDMPYMVRLCSSGIPGVGYGIQAKHSIPIGAWIGPYQGNFIVPDEVKHLADSSFLWEIFKDGKLFGYIDGSDENTSSWMRFIRCARHKQEQNLYAFQYMNKIYYRTHKTIEPGQELLVWYDSMYTQYLGIPCEGIYDMSSPNNSTSNLLGTTVKVTEEARMITSPATPTKCPDNPFNHQVHNLASSPNKSPLGRDIITKEQFCSNLDLNECRGFSNIQVAGNPPHSCTASMSPLQPDKMFLFTDLAVTAKGNQNETRKRASGAQPIRNLSQTCQIITRINNDNLQKSANESASVHAITEGNTEVASQEQFSGFSKNADESKASYPTVFEASNRSSSLNQEKDPIAFTRTSPVGFQQQTSESTATQLQCGQCKTLFNHRAMLETHVCAGVLLKPYQCGQCNETFSNPGMMRLHVVTHRGKKPFKCGYCMRSFSGATTLNNHIRTHTGEKPFDCLKCGKTFTKGLQLSKHYRMPGDCVPCS